MEKGSSRKANSTLNIQTRHSGGQNLYIRFHRGLLPDAWATWSQSTSSCAQYVSSKACNRSMGSAVTGPKLLQYAERCSLQCNACIWNFCSGAVDGISTSTFCRKVFVYRLWNPLKCSLKTSLECHGLWRHICYYLLNINFLTLRLQAYLLTPWSRVPLQKLTSSQLVKKFPAL
jgi:hypothetical protein